MSAIVNYSWYKNEIFVGAMQRKMLDIGNTSRIFVISYNLQP